MTCDKQQLNKNQITCFFTSLSPLLYLQAEVSANARRDAAANRMTRGRLHVSATNNSSDSQVFGELTMKRNALPLLVSIATVDQLIEVPRHCDGGFDLRHALPRLNFAEDDGLWHGVDAALLARHNLNLNETLRCEKFTNAACCSKADGTAAWLYAAADRRPSDDDLPQSSGGCTGRFQT